MLLDLQHLPTSVLRTVVSAVLGRVVDSRTHCISLLRSRGILAISEDGSEYGLGEYHSADPPVPVVARRYARSMEPISTAPPYNNFADESIAGNLRTDAAFDVLTTQDLHVTHDIRFQDLTELGSLRQELFVESTNRLEDINRETEQMKADIDAFIDNLRVEPFGNQLVRIPLTNKLGTSHALRMRPETVKFDTTFFKCLRSDEFVFVSLECRVTECRNVDVIQIDLPFHVRASFVPFQMILKEIDNDSSGMGRAYAKNGNTLYVESYLLQNITNPVYINVHGHYLTNFSEPHRDTPITWVTPMKVEYPGRTLLSTDMLTLLNIPANSDIGFHEGVAYFHRVDERVDVSMSVTFRQRTGTIIPRLSCVIDFPLTKDTLVHQHNVGYGSTYLPEYRTHVVKPPNIRMKQTDRSIQFVIDAYVGYKPFHECTVFVNVTYFIQPLQNIHKFVKPILTGNTSIQSYSTINLSNINMYDTHLFNTNKDTLLDMYNLKINAVNELRNEYTEYTFTDMSISVDSNLTNDRYEMSNIVLYNQVDQHGRTYLYPRRKLFHMQIRMLNKANEYEGYDQPNGGYELLPDFTQ